MNSNTLVCFQSFQELKYKYAKIVMNSERTKCTSVLTEALRRKLQQLCQVLQSVRHDAQSQDHRKTWHKTLDYARPTCTCVLE